MQTISFYQLNQFAVKQEFTLCMNLDLCSYKLHIIIKLNIELPTCKESVIIYYMHMTYSL